jgi:hypothetical protein
MAALAPVAAASGIGWAVAGRPRFGLIMGVARVIAAIIATTLLFVLLANALCEGPRCARWHPALYWITGVGLWGSTAFVFVWPIVSALAVAYVVDGDRLADVAPPADASLAEG